MRASHTRSHWARASIWASCSLIALSGCRVIGSNAWNLREVHQSDGSPSRRGNLRGSMDFVIAELLAQFGSDGDTSGAESSIEDPLWVCHSNLLELFDGDREDVGDIALMVDFVTWLGADCTYVLSRERCATELGDLGRRFGAETPLTLAEDADPADADAVRTALEPLLARGDEAALEQACDGVRALVLDRDGVRRAFAVASLMVRSGRRSEHGLESFERLRLDLGRRALELTLAAALRDPESLVRAAALRSWIQWTNGRSEEPVAHAFRDGHPDLVLAAIEALSEFGAPEVDERSFAGAISSAEEYWMDRVVVLLTRLIDGPVQVAACRAMAALSGQPENLHPEFWVRWWEGRLSSAAAASTSLPSEPEAP